VEEAGVEGESGVDGCAGVGVGLVEGGGRVLVEGVVLGGDERVDDGMAVFQGGVG